MAFVALATLASCELDRYPLTNFSEDTFFDKEENTKLALIGLYRGGISQRYRIRPPRIQQ